METNLHDFPVFIKNAIILLEDRDFYSNSWISFKSLIRATFHNIFAGKIVEWGSTISSQLIRSSIWLNDERNLIRKFKEFFYALALNVQYSKDEILSRYLNMLYFGYLNYWFASSSQYYFNSTLNNLTLAQQIALITIPKNSNKYDPFKNPTTFRKRFVNLVNYFYINNLLSEDEYKLVLSEKIDFNANNQNKLPYVTDYISRTKWQPQTTIDYFLSQQIDKLASTSIKALSWKHATDYWILVVDRKTNEIRVMIGWSDYTWVWGQYSSVTALRQPGSALKPFTYLLAFKEFGLGPQDTITDLPIQFQTSRWYSYTPKNFSLKYKWEVSFASALSESLNVPAVKLLNQLWTEKLLNFLRQLWMTSLNQNAEFYWLALTLWAWEVSLYDLLQSYTIFANNGSFCSFSIANSGHCKPIIEKQFIDQINLILSNRYFKINGFPINSNLDFEDRQVFVKTWTSRDFRDNLAIWYTDNYLIWVWVWNKDGTPMKMVSWTTGAWEIFRKIVYTLENNVNINKPNELNIKKTNYIEITSPVNWSVYKLNNSTQNIKLEFSTNIKYNKYYWLYDNKKIEWWFIPVKQWKHTIDISLITKQWEIINSSWTYLVIN